MGKKKKEKDIDARLYEMAMRFQRSNQSVEGGKAERHEGLSAAAIQIAMDDDARVRWQQGLTEDMKYLILLIRQCLEENASLRESVSCLGDNVAKEHKKTKRLKKEMKRNRNDIERIMQKKRSGNNRSRGMSRPYTYVCKRATKVKYIKFCRIFKRKEYINNI